MTVQNRTAIQHSLFAAGAFFIAAVTASLVGCGSGSLASSASNPIPRTNPGGPQLGYAWNSADTTLRSIPGVPGASLVGQPLTTTGLYIGGAASARSSIALLEGSDGSLYSESVPAGTPTRIAGGLGANLQIVFSPSGTSAVLYSPSTTTLTLVTALTTTPQVQTLTAPAPLVSATVGDRQQVVIATGSGPVMLSLFVAGNATTLTTVAQLGGFGFIPNSDDLLFADAAKTALSILRSISTAPAPQDISAPAIAAPVAVAASLDGRWALLANSGSKSLVRIDLTAATPPLTIACACQPDRLDPLHGNAVFRITALGAGPTYIVNASAATPQTLFIPAVKP